MVPSGVPRNYIGEDKPTVSGLLIGQSPASSLLSLAETGHPSDPRNWALVVAGRLRLLGSRFLQGEIKERLLKTLSFICVDKFWYWDQLWSEVVECQRAVTMITHQGLVESCQGRQPGRHGIHLATSAQNFLLSLALTLSKIGLFLFTLWNMRTIRNEDFINFTIPFKKPRKLH